MKKLIILGSIILGAISFAEAPKFGIYDGQRIYRAGSKDIPDKSKCTYIGDEEDVWCLTPATKKDIEEYLKYYPHCEGEYGCSLPDELGIIDESGLTDSEKDYIFNKRK